jgi:hypothetical protein
MSLKEQVGADVPKKMDVYRQACANLNGALDLFAQLLGRLGSALSRRKKIAGAISHEKRSKFFQVKLEKSDDIRWQFKLKGVLVLDLPSRDDEMNECTRAWTTVD